jgi:hypothetical protein
LVLHPEQVLPMKLANNLNMSSIGVKRTSGKFCRIEIQDDCDAKSKQEHTQQVSQGRTCKTQGNTRWDVIECKLAENQVPGMAHQAYR